MKKIYTLLALTISFSINAQWLLNSNGGWGIQTNFSTASGDHSTAMGNSTTASGNYSTAMGNNTTASGDWSTAMGVLTTASGSRSTAMGQGTEASGSRSTAMGQGTEASGDYSTAIGYNTTASGYASSAMGRYTTASGYASSAMGNSTTASGGASTAMGWMTTASDYSSTVIGQYNSSGSSATSADSFSTSAPAFVIGNGTASNAKSDAFKVMFNGDTYISSSLYIGGTAITSTAAEINLLDGLTTVGSGILSSVTENGNTGVRLSTANSTNHGDIGSNAVDLSYSDSSSTTKGATGTSSTAMGNSTTASGYVDTAMGWSTTASGGASTAMGWMTTASQAASTAMGRSTTASGDNSTAMGWSTTASGRNSTAMGWSTTASDYASLVIGQYNSSLSSLTTNGSASDPDLDNTAFVIGNGTASNAKSDAFKVMFNGDTTVSNDLTVNGDVNISSDARLKSNIVSLGSTLPKLLQIDGKSYEMKGKQKIGVLAQEIQEVFPELVCEGDNEMLAVNYQGLVPVLINALKEQDAKMNEQQSEIDELKEIVQALVSRE